MNTGEISGAVLAYLGDAVIELTVRRALIEKGSGDVGEMNKVADGYVRATAQSLAVDKILPMLTEDETAIYKRGRNTHSHTVPKSAKVSDYRKATGMEALFGALYLEGKQERIEEIFRAAYDI
ncbi:MAG: ribonuclease III [Clostridia bacterium]|nr:ribonuclease III [Clostridia bacterium]